jgi:triacylglycerol esterase/lipase EstA (alpha/beta hydrolase family)
MKERIVYLVPGFFGFASLGTVTYFRGVAEVLEEELARLGRKARVVACATEPTGSIRRRAEQLLQNVLDTGGLEARELHFVGHSTGGLDVRLLLSPGVRLRDDGSEDEVIRRTRTAITVSTPHRGTPLANFFLTAQGQRLLETLAILATSRQGRGVLWVGAQALSLVASLDNWTGRTDTFLDELSRNILSRVTLTPGDPMFAFLDAVKSDQGLVIQLTPEAMDLIHAALPDNPGIRYGCVITAAPPSLQAFAPRDFRSPDRAIFASLFIALHAIVGRASAQYPCPTPSPADRALLIEGLGFDVGPRTNDGIVPTLSQLHGPVLAVARADHLDVVGQFAGDTAKPLDDWLPSGSRFDQEGFEAVWKRVAAAMVVHDRK